MVPKKEKQQQIDSKSKPFAIEKKYKGWTVGNCVSINCQRGGGERGKDHVKITEP